MHPLQHLTGRLGNQLYQFAFLYNARKLMGLGEEFPNSPHWIDKFADELYPRIRVHLKLRRENRVAIHVRRGDYLEEFRVQYPLPLAYYQKAMALFPGERFLVFSDDIPWCKANFPANLCDFSEGHTDWEDLGFMASCPHQIISNSTLATWGALLNPNPHKTVVAPSKWEKGDWKPKLPSNWILLSC